MEKIELTFEQIANYLCEDNSITEQELKNALLSNIVIAEINSQVDFLREDKG